MKNIAATLGLVLLCGWCNAALSTNDDFNSNIKDTSRWGADTLTGTGVLIETNQQLEYHVTDSPSSFDQDRRPWAPSRGPYNADWEVQVDTFNIAQATGTIQQVATGISIADPRVYSNEIINVMFAIGSGQPQSQYGFIGRLSDVSTNIYASTTSLPVTNGAVRVVFNSTTKVFSLFYDTDPTNGYTWIPLGTFGVNGSGGADGNVSWGLSDTNQILVRIYSYSQNTAVAAGEVALDNFQATGLVTPLVGTLSKAKEKCKTKNNVTTCKLGAGLALLNSGDGEASATHLRFFLSTDTIYDVGIDTLLGETTTKAIKPGKSGKAKLKAVTGASAAGQFILAVDDNDKVLASLQLPGV